MLIQSHDTRACKVCGVPPVGPSLCVHACIHTYMGTCIPTYVYKYELLLSLIYMYLYVGEPECQAASCKWQNGWITKLRPGVRDMEPWLLPTSYPLRHKTITNIARLFLNALKALAGFWCLRYALQRLGDFEPVSGGRNRACRGASPGDNSATYYQVLGGGLLESNRIWRIRFTC